MVGFDAVFVVEGRVVAEESRAAVWLLQGEPRGKALQRQVKRALGLGKKLEEKQGQLIFKGMPG